MAVEIYVMVVKEEGSKYMKPRILCIVGNMNAGGAETFLMKMFRKLDKRKYQMDFCVSANNKGFYDDEIEKLGGKIIHITKKTKNPLKNFFDIKNAVKKGNYQSVMRISQHSMSALDLFAAKMGGAKKLIFRSSNSNSCGSFLNRIMHLIFKPLAIIIPNVKIAPSDKAAIHMFGEKQYKNGKVVILNNGLSIDEYKYNGEIRNRKRKELNIDDDELIIGHVGRMTQQKNHLFLIDVFEKYLKINDKCKLLLIGDGELKEKIIDNINKKGIQNKVILLGIRKDTNDLYQAMDCFVFPSLYEGMPNTVIEAQTSGLYCIVSNTITKEVDLTGNVKFINLNDDNIWVQSIMKSQKRNSSYLKVKQNGYDIEDVVNIFIKYVF